MLGHNLEKGAERSARFKPELLSMRSSTEYIWSNGQCLARNASTWSHSLCSSTPICATPFAFWAVLESGPSIVTPYKRDCLDWKLFGSLCISYVIWVVVKICNAYSQELTKYEEMELLYSVLRRNITCHAPFRKILRDRRLSISIYHSPDYEVEV